MKNTFKGNKKNIQEGSEAPRMANPKENKKGTKLLKLKVAPNFIIWINPSTSLLETKVELLNNKFSPQQD